MVTPDGRHYLAGLFGEDGLGPFAFAGGDVGGDAIEESVEFADMVAAEPAGRPSGWRRSGSAGVGAGRRGRCGRWCSRHP